MPWNGQKVLSVYSTTGNDFFTVYIIRTSKKKRSRIYTSQCYNLQRTTIQEFANQICDRAKEYDTDVSLKRIHASVMQIHSLPFLNFS
jgi:hypothetical protein